MNWLRFALTLDALALAVLGMAVAFWAESPIAFAVFGLLAVCDAGLIVAVLTGPWSIGRAWLFRASALVWLTLAPLPSLGLLMSEPAGHRLLLGMEPALWAGLAELGGPILLALVSLLPETAIFDGRIRGLRRFPAVIAFGAAAAILWPIAGTAATVQMAGCAPTWLVSSDPFFCTHLTVRAGVISISGETSLPDGSQVTVALRDPSSLQDLAGSRRPTVVDGRFTTDLDTSTVEGGRALVVVEFIVSPLRPQGGGDADPDVLEFGPSPHPAAVVDRYGIDGAGLRGPAAVWMDGPLWLKSAPSYQELRTEIAVTF